VKVHVVSVCPQGQLSAAIAPFDEAVALVSPRSRVGGEATLQKAICLDSMVHSRMLFPHFSCMPGGHAFPSFSLHAWWIPLVHFLHAYPRCGILGLACPERHSGDLPACHSMLVGTTF
jgi:hypothetical protein